jgi:hypothetical protein
MDPSSVRIEGQIAFTQGLRLTRSGQSVIEELQIYSPMSGDHIVDLKHFNVLQTALCDLTFSDRDIQEGSLSNTQLYGSDEYREQIYVGTSFSLQLNHDLFKLPSYFPTWLSGGLRIKLTLAPVDKAFMKTDLSLTPGSYDYAMTNMKAAYDVVSVDQRIVQQYNNAFNNNSLQFKIPTWRYSTYTSRAQIDNIRITNLANSNRALLMVPRYVNTVNSATEDSLGRRTAASLRQLSVKIGDAVARTHDTTKGAASLVALMQQAIDFTSTSTSINAKNYHCALPFPPNSKDDLDRSSKFLLLQSLELDNTDPSVLSGISKQDISIAVDYKDPPPGDILYLSFVLVDQIVSLGKDIGFKCLT